LAFDAAAQVYRLSHRGAVTITYELDLRHPDNRRGRLTVREVASGRFPLAGAGLYYRRPDGTIVAPREFRDIWTEEDVAVSHEVTPQGDGVIVTVREVLEGQPHDKRYSLRLAGRSLAVRAQSLDPGGVPAGAGGYAGFTAGDIEGSSDGVNVRLPYMDAVPVTMLDHRWFASTLLDYPISRANALEVRGPAFDPNSFANEVAAHYLPDAAGRTRPVDETVWVTLSPDVSDTFAVPDQPPSPHRPALSSWVHVTLAGRAPDATFAGARAYADELRDWRVRDVLFHLPHWEDPAVRRPAQGPPDPAAGGAEAFATLVAATGGRVAPTLAYTLTIPGCPGAPNPLYRPADRVPGADGQPKAAGTLPCPDGSPADLFLLAPDAAARLAPGAARDLARAGARALDVDAVATWNPAFPWPGAGASALDESAAPAHPATIGEAIQAYKRLLGALQAGAGPVFGPGAWGLWETGYESFYAGYLDGAARSLATGSAEQTAGAPYLVVPDYALTVARPRMIGYGMGPYERFFADVAGDAPRPLTEGERDEWLATLLAYGHAGAWTAQRGTATPPGDWLSPAEQVAHYFVTRALQARYLDAALVSVRYLDANGAERDLSWALTHDFDLAGPRLHVTFGGGLELWLNHAPAVWTVSAGGGTHLLPEHGWLARGPDGLLAYSALVEGHRADFLQAPEVTVLDGRGRLINFGGPTARDLVVRFPDGWRLEEQADGSLVWLEGAAMGRVGRD